MIKLIFHMSNHILNITDHHLDAMAGGYSEPLVAGYHYSKCYGAHKLKINKC